MLHRRTTQGTDLYGTLKGGRPNQTPHGHMDAGDFILEAMGRRWSANIGLDGYASAYFNAATRFDFFRANNFGHNTLVVGGGKPRADVGARVRFAPDHGQGKASAFVDLSQAFPASPGGTPRTIVRTLSLTDAGSFVVSDRVEHGEPGTLIEWRMLFCPQVPQVFTPAEGCAAAQRVVVAAPDVATNTKATATVSDENMTCPGAKYLAMKIVKPAPHNFAQTVLPRFAVIDVAALPNAAPTRFTNPLPDCQMLSVTDRVPTNGTLDLEVEMTPKVAP